MPVNVNDIIRKLSPAERKRVTARAREIIAEEMSLRDLRKARKLTQAGIAKTLGITQDSVSRLEARGDLLLSTLRKTVKAMGGDVRIVVQFPGRSPIVLSQLPGERPRRKSSRRTKPTKRNIEQAQRLSRRQVKPGNSLADELVAKRRATKNEAYSV